jgi:thioredoxin-related protein
MKSLSIAGLLVALLAVAAPARAELFSASATDLAAEATAAAREGKQLAVLFEQEDCDACRKLKKTVLSDKATERLFGRGYRTVSVNLTKDSDITLPDGKAQSPKAWAGRLRIVGTPAIAFFDKNGQLLYRHVGAPADSQEFVLLGRYVASAEYEKRPFVSYLSAQRLGGRASVIGKGEICHTPS